MHHCQIKTKKIFWAGGIALSQTPPHWEGVPSDPWRLDSRAFGARHSFSLRLKHGVYSKHDLDVFPKCITHWEIPNI